jgi:hypothetical protein
LPLPPGSIAANTAANAALRTILMAVLLARLRLAGKHLLQAHAAQVHFNMPFHSR